MITIDHIARAQNNVTHSTRSKALHAYNNKR